MKDVGVIRPEFFKLRPPNFPTIRLSQLANLYANQQNLFDKVVNATSLKELYVILDASASTYWTDHFTFGKSSKKSPRKLTKNFIDLLIINTILPLKFCYAKHLGKDANEEILHISASLKAENNTIISNFKNHEIKVENAKESQSVIQLYNEYCTKNKCLECAVGNTLLNK